MRKKSHLSLAGYLIKVDRENIIRYGIFFRFGSLEPDLIPTFITTKHRIDLTLPKLERLMHRTLCNFDPEQGITPLMAARLGVITHYTADYFTFPHNLEYPGSMAGHIHYEELLKRRFREFVRESLESGSLYLEERPVKSIADVIGYIKKEHAVYLHSKSEYDFEEGERAIEEDCEFIIRICTNVIGSILYLAHISAAAAAGTVLMSGSTAHL